MTLDKYVADMRARIAAATTLEDLAAVEQASERIFEMSVPGIIRMTVRGDMRDRIVARTREIIG